MERNPCEQPGLVPLPESPDPGGPNPSNFKTVDQLRPAFARITMRAETSERFVPALILGDHFGDQVARKASGFGS